MKCLKAKHRRESIEKVTEVSRNETGRVGKVISGGQRQKLSLKNKEGINPC